MSCLYFLIVNLIDKRNANDREAVVEFNFDTASGFCIVPLRIIRSLAYLIKEGNGNAMIIAGRILDVKVNT